MELPNLKQLQDEAEQKRLRGEEDDDEESVDGNVDQDGNVDEVGDAQANKGGAAALQDHYVGDLEDELSSLKLEFNKLKVYLSTQSTDGQRARALRPQSYEEFDPDATAAASSCAAPPGLSWGTPSAPPMPMSSAPTVMGSVVGIFKHQ